MPIAAGMLGDPISSAMPPAVAGLTSKAYARQLAAQIDPAGTACGGHQARPAYQA